MEHGHHGVVIPSGDDLNVENWQRSLEISASTDLPAPEVARSVGDSSNPLMANDPYPSPSAMANDRREVVAPPRGEAFTSYPLSPNMSVDPVEAAKNSLELGQITPVNGVKNDVVTRVDYNPVNIRTAGDRLEKSSITEVDNAIDRLDQTGDLNNFYEEIRGEGSMLEANLNNSFNRKLYDQGENR